MVVIVYVGHQGFLAETAYARSQWSAVESDAVNQATSVVIDDRSCGPPIVMVRVVVHPMHVVEAVGEIRVAWVTAFVKIGAVVEVEVATKTVEMTLEHLVCVEEVMAIVVATDLAAWIICPMTQPYHFSLETIVEVRQPAASSVGVEFHPLVFYVHWHFYFCHYVL